MWAPQALIKGIVARLLPPPKPDIPDLDQGIRLGRYGELMGVPGVPATKNNLLREGSYWCSRTPTPGTGVASNVQATFSDTVPFLYLFNKDPAGGKSVELDYLKIIVTVAAASGTTAQYAVKLDNGAGAGGTGQGRFPTTNNTTAAVPISNNFEITAPASVLQVLYQSSGTASAVPAASSNARVAAEGAFGGLTIVGDELVVEFGKTDQSASYVLTAAQATFPGRKVSSAPPVVLAPQTSAVVHLWFAGNATTGLSYSFELGHAER